MTNKVAATMLESGDIWWIGKVADRRLYVG